MPTPTAEPNKIITLSKAFKFSQMSMDDFRLLSVLGRGHFGKVNNKFIIEIIWKLINDFTYNYLGNSVST